MLRISLFIQKNLLNAHMCRALLKIPEDNASSARKEHRCIPYREHVYEFLESSFRDLNCGQPSTEEVTFWECILTKYAQEISSQLWLK